MAQQADGTVYIDTLLDTTGFKAGGKEVEAAVRRMSKTVSGIGATAKIAMQKQADAFVKANQSYAQQERKVESLREKLKDLESQKAPTEEYKALDKELESLNAELDKIKAKQQEWLDLGFSEADVFSKTKKEYDAIAAKIDVVKAKQKEMKDAGTAFVSTDSSIATQKLYVEEQRLQQMNNSLSTSYASLKNKVESYSGSAINLTTIKKRLDKAFSPLVSTVRKVAKAVGGSLVSGLKKAGAAMLNLHKSTGKSNRSLGSGLKTMLKYGLGVRSIFVLVNRMRSALVEGFKNLAQYDGRTNASISSLMSALTQLKNSFATAFAPILNVVAPILKTFINMVSRAVTYVGMLIAALTGQDSFVRATEVQEDYAASLSDTADGYKKTEKAQNRYLSGLDEIRRWENPNDNNSDNGGGGGYTAPTPGEMFETVPIENSLKNLAEKIKEMWKNADFSELGRTVGEKIKDALGKIPWDTIKPTAKKVGKSIATFLNGGIEVPGFAASIGKSVGELINTGLSLASGFIEKFRFDSLGWFIADGMNSAIDTISWSGIGTTIRNGLNGVFKAAETWSGKFNFKQLGKAVRTLINSTLTGINWKSAITAVKNIGKGIADSINEVITPETFGNIGKTIAGAVNTAVAGAYSFLSTADFKTFANSIATGINDFLKDTNWEDIGRTIGAGLQAAIDFVSTLISSIEWENVVQALQDLWQGICEKVDMGQAGNILMSALGAWLAVNAALAIGSEVVKRIGASIVSGIVSSVLGAITSASFSPVIAAIVAVVAGGLLVIKNWDKIKNAAGKLKDFVLSKWTDIKEGIGKSWDAVKAKTSTIWNNITSFMSESYKKITTTFSTIGDWFKGKFEAAYTNITTAFSLIGGWFQGKYEDVQGVFDLVGDWFKSKFDTAYSNVKTAFSGAGVFFSGVWKNIKNSFSHVSDWFENTFSKAWKAVKNVFSTGGAVFVGITTGILNGFKSVVNALIRGINNVITIPFSGINSALQGIKNVKIIDWYPFSWMPTINTPQIPYLATGAVIPPNAPFAAILGDQKHGTNIEAPLSTIEQAVTNAMRKNGNNSQNMTIRIPVILDGRQVFEAIIDEARMKQLVSGRNPFEMG